MRGAVYAPNGGIRRFRQGVSSPHSVMLDDPFLDGLDRYTVLRRLGAVRRMQRGRLRVRLEVVREGGATALALRIAQGLELLAAFGDQLVVVRRRGGLGFGHEGQRGRAAEGRNPPL